MDMPTLQLRKDADALDAKTDVAETDLNAREDKLRKEREQQFGQLKEARGAAAADYKAASDDLQSSVGKRENVPMPNTDLGPPIDPDTFKSFTAGIMALAAIGAVAGRKHWLGAAEALDGSLRGFIQGNMEVAKEKREKFDRDYKEAQAAQGKADKRYQDILESKKLSLNAKALQLQTAAVEFQDWDMYSKAQQHDYDGMARRIDSNRKRSESMKTLATKLDEQAMFKKMASDAKAEKEKSGQLPEDTLRFMAKQYNSGDKSVFQNLGRGAQGAENVSRLRAFIVEDAHDRHMTPEQISTKLAEYEGLKASMRTLGTREANMETAAYEARSFADLALDAAKKVPRTGFVPLNKLVEKVEEGTASPDQRQLVIANRSLINAYAQVASRSGAKNIHDTVAAEQMLLTADGHDAYKAGVEQLKKEIDVAVKAPGQTRSALEQRAGGSQGPKAGAVEDGYRFKGGDAGDPKNWEAVP